jgi:hypothetical protein
VDEALGALGGDRYLSMRDRIERGRSYSFYHERLSGLSRTSLYTRYLTRPEPPTPGFIGLRERQAIGKKEDVLYLFTADGANEITYRGARPLPDDTFERWRESLLHNVLYTLRMRIGEPGLTFDLKGSDIVDNLPVDIVEIVDSDGRATTVYFDHQQKYPVRQKWSRRDPRTGLPIEEVTVFAKYRDVGDGIHWPFVIRRDRSGERIFEMYSDEVQVNKELPDNLFLLPGNIKMLPKQP